MLSCGGYQAIDCEELGFVCFLHEVFTITKRPARANWSRAITDKSADHSC